MTNAQPDRSSQSQFGRLAGAYGASKTHAQAGALASAASMLSDRRYGTAVDIGAGPGFTAFAVADHCDRVIATDVTPEMLDQARSLHSERGAPQTELMLTAAESLPCRDGSLDLITCRTAAHHFLAERGAPRPRPRRRTHPHRHRLAGRRGSHRMDARHRDLARSLPRAEPRRG